MSGDLGISGIATKEMSATSSSGAMNDDCDSDFGVQVHLGRLLRELFDAPSEPLPQRLLELLQALAAKDKQHLTVSSSLKDALLSLVPNLRAFAYSLCGNHEWADDLVQETLLKAWS